MPPAQTDAQRQATFAAAGQQPVPQAPTPQQPATQPQPLPQANPNPPMPTGVQTTPLTSPVPSTSLAPAPTVNLPQPTAPAVQSSYFGSVANDVQNTQASLQAAYDKQSADIQSQLDTLKSQEQSDLGQEQQLSQPFKAQLEQTQEQQLHVNDNFNANQTIAPSPMVLTPGTRVLYLFSCRSRPSETPFRPAGASRYGVPGGRVTA